MANRQTKKQLNIKDLPLFLLRQNIRGTSAGNTNKTTAMKMAGTQSAMYLQRIVYNVL